MKISPKAQTWLEMRGLDPSHAESLGLVSGSNRGGEYLAIPFVQGGKVLNHKYRALDEKRHWQDDGAEKVAWNIDALTEPEYSGPVVITEGEWDALTALEAGLERVVSAPDGAPGERIEDPQSRKYDWLPAVIDAVRNDKKIVLATDGDQPGANLRDDLAFRLGKPRCYFVEYPEGCKDLNDVLLEHGLRAVRELIENAKPIPVDGVYKLSDLPPPRELTIWRARFARNYESRVAICGGHLSVWTGVPGHGKSTLVRATCNQLALDFGLRTCIAPFEDEPETDFRRDVTTWLLNKRHQDLDAADRRRGDEFINEHYRFMVPDWRDDVTLDWVLEKMETAVVRDGCRICVVDPWNKMDHAWDREFNENTYTAMCLKMFQTFARRFNVHVAVVAHPTKLQKKADGSYDPPGGYDVSGCYSDDTDVLTRHGWKRHDSLTLMDEVACFDPASGRMVYHQPLRIIRKPYRGLMHRFRGYGYDLLVTPEHRMLVKAMWREPVGSDAPSSAGRRKYPKGEWVFREAAKLPSARFAIPLSAPLAGEKGGDLSPDLAALAGWYVSEGSGYYPGFTIAQGEGARADEIHALLLALGLDFSVHHGKPGGKGGQINGLTFYVGAKANRPVVEWVKSFGIGSHNKRIAPAIFDASREVKAEFLRAYLAGDGSKKKDGWCASTTSERLSGDLQHLCAEIGLATSAHKQAAQSDNHRDVWQINISRPGRTQTTLERARNESFEDYSGDVWCLTVPTGAYFVRRNGKVCVCGNSANWSNMPELGVTAHIAKDKGADAALVRIWKSKRHAIMGRPGDLYLRINPETGRYQQWEEYSLDESRPVSDGEAQRVIEEIPF